LLQSAPMPQAPGEDLERLVADHTGPLLRGALALGFPPADAEELVQDSFVAYLDAGERFERRSSPRTYLFGILYNKGAALSRKRAKELASDDVEKAFDARFSAAGHWLADEPKGPEDAALTQELAAIIRRCAEGLSQSQREAFFLKEAEGASSEEVCNVLGVSGTNLRVLLFRARLRLRECLEKTWEAR
jgi:RNA polymerase sigma factor (sigma-70 family)